MNTSHQISENVLLATARIQAALELIPHIVGPKEAWVPWMRDNLEAEVVSNTMFVFCKKKICFLDPTFQTHRQLSTPQTSGKPGQGPLRSL